MVIRKGDRINTLVGYLELIEPHTIGGNQAVFAEYEVTENGEEVYMGERLLAASEVAREAKEYDGENHEFFIERS